MVPENKGTKPSSDPGVFPGTPGKVPFLDFIYPANSDSLYFNARFKNSYMKIKPAILYRFLISSLLLSAFNNSKAGTFNQFFSLSGIFHPVIQNDSGGRAVNIDSAQACIDRYAALMAAHGFANQAGLPINIHLTKTSLITTGESFVGKNFLDWLNATASQYTAAGKTLMIKIQMGVYDINYLNTYEPDPARRKAVNNRTAIFVIPYDAVTGKTVMELAQPMGGAGGGGTGYDLGGIQP